MSGVCMHYIHTSAGLQQLRSLMTGRVVKLKRSISVSKLTNTLRLSSERSALVPPHCGAKKRKVGLVLECLAWVHWDLQQNQMHFT